MEPTLLAATSARIAVVTDRRMEREMLCSLLSTQEWLEVVVASDTIAGLDEKLDPDPPDLVLATPYLADGSGIRWARGFKERHPQVRIIFLAHERNELETLEAVSAGAEGYVVDDTSLERFLNAVQQVAGGDCCFDQRVVESLLRQFASTLRTHSDVGAFRHVHSLSDREKEIARLCIEGLTNSQIAGRAFVSVNTVKSHLRRIYQRLGISSREELRQFQWELALHTQPANR